MNVARGVTRYLYFVFILTPLVFVAACGVPLVLLCYSVWFAVDAGGAWAFQNKSVRETWNRWCGDVDKD